MKFSWKNLIKIGAVIFIIYLLAHYLDGIVSGIGIIVAALTPLFIGFAIAYAVNIPMCFFEKLYLKNIKSKKAVRIHRPVCMVLAFLSVILIIFIVIELVLPELISCFQLLAEKIPPVMQNISEYIANNEKLQAFFPEMDNVISNINFDWQDIVEKIMTWFKSGFGGMVNYVVGVVSKTVSVVLNSAIGIIFSVYMLSNKERLLRQINGLIEAYIKTPWKRKIRYAADVLNTSFHRFIVGQCTEAVILGVLCILGMLVFRFPYALMIGTLIGFTALIPIAGAYIGAGIGAFMIFTVSPVKALLFLIFVVILQQAEGNLIYPKVVGASISLPGMWVLLAITVGGSVMGIAGMLIGVPIAAACYKMLKTDVSNRCMVQVKPKDEEEVKEE